MGIPVAEVLEICIPSAIFLRNNVKKVENGDTARGTVVFAQGAKIAQAVAKYHDDTAKSASEAYNIFGKYAQKYKPLDLAGKGVNWATKNVNPLIYASGVYKTVTSDDKVKTGIVQLGAISSMRLGERFMSANMDKVINQENITKLAEHCKDNKFLKSLADYVLKSGNSNKIAAVAKGILFVCTSLTCYDIGENVADRVANRVCTDLELTNHEDKQKINHLT